MTKARCQLLHLDPSLHSAAHHSRAAIDDVNVLARYDRNRRTHAIGFRVGIAGTEQDDASILRERRQADQHESEAHAFPIVERADSSWMFDYVGVASGWETYLQHPFAMSFFIQVSDARQ